MIAGPGQKNTELPSPPGNPGDPACDDLYTIVNSLAHEIRNPLNALSVNLHLLGREVGDGPGADKLAAALAEIGRLDDLLSAFLRFTRPKKPTWREANLARVLHDFQTFITPVAAGSGADLEFRDIPDINLETDADLLKQALLNIILNSVEAGAGRVELSAEDRGDKITVRVLDDGPGFQEPDRAFEPFYSTKTEGSGLGLPTSRAIVDSLGGTLELGDPVSGAEVLLTIPKTTQAQA
jgi:signal transduction histidine kinase